MSSLFFLSTDDFYNARASDNNNVLCHHIKGFSFVLFYSNNCVHSQQLLPIFKTLPPMINGCAFGIVNLQQNMDLVHFSKGTNTEISFVPLLILYINGYPYANYTGPANIPTIQNFILNISNSVHETGFMETIKSNGIPAFSIGHPLYGQTSIEYLEYNNIIGYKKSS